MTSCQGPFRLSLRRLLPIFLSLCLGLLLVTAVLAAVRRNQEDAGTGESAAQVANVQPLGIDGGDSSARHLNDRGQVVGVSIFTDTAEQAFLWEDGFAMALNPVGYEAEQANGINALGMVAGAVLTAVQDAPFWQPALWQSGTLTVLVNLSDTMGVAHAVNEDGQAVGYYEEENGVRRAVLWHGSAITELGSLGGEGSQAWDVDGAGRVVGEATDEMGHKRPVLWYRGVLTDLDTLGGDEGAALAINGEGQIVGWTTISEELTHQAFLWQNGVITPLLSGEDPSQSSSQANDVNDRGEAVGWVETGGERRAVLWRDGEMIELNSWLAPGSEWERLESANAINNAGWIAGSGTADGRQQGFLLRPGTSVYLPLLLRRPLAPPYDMAALMVGDQRLYEVQHSIGSQARHQTHVEGTTFYHTKGNEIEAEWEELWYTEEFVYRGTDTSPGDGRYYTLRDNGVYGSAWAPRYWHVGDLFERNPEVTFYNKSDCSVNLQGRQRSWLLFEAFHDTYTFESGITLSNVVQLAWLPHPDGNPLERYFYAQDYGLVGWSSSTHGMSYISEIHAPGARPDNTREVIPCLDRSSPLAQPLSPIQLPHWPGDHRR